jgi:hypothetical protein
MLGFMTVGWTMTNTAWMVKLARAEVHLNELRSRDLGGSDVEQVYRLHEHQPVPADFSAIIGDVVHNLRSALDCLAYAFAEHNAGGSLTPTLERRTHFPIIDDDEGFRAFVRDHGAPYTDQQLRAMRAVQPGHYHDAGVHAGDAEDADYRRAEVRHDLLRALKVLNDVDKHRRLHLTAWEPDMAFWGSDGQTSKRWKAEPPPYEHGTGVGRLVNMNPSEPQPHTDVTVEVQLQLIHPAPYREPVVLAIQRIRDHVNRTIEDVIRAVSVDEDRLPAWPPSQRQDRRS